MGRRLFSPAISLAAVCATGILPGMGRTAQVQQVGLGSYLTLRNAAVTKVPTDTWTPSITDDYSQKVLSNKWWATLMTSPYSGQLFAHPCAFKADSAGLQMAYPGASKLTADPKIFESAFNQDFRVGIKGMNAAAAKVAHVGHWSVTARWTDGAKLMEASMAQGSPFTYFKLAGGEVGVTFTDAPVIWHNQGGVIGLTVHGHHWALFAPTGSIWTGNGPLGTTLNGKTYLSVALLPDPSEATLAFFQKYAYAFVADTKVGYEYNEAKAQMTSHFTAITVPQEGTETGTVFAMFRHQWLSSPSPLTAYAYASARGEMKVAAGKEVTTVMTFNGVLPVLPALGYDPARLNRYILAMQPRYGNGDPYIVPTETYTSGKSMHKFGEAAQIAGITGDNVQRDLFLKADKTLLENWFTADDTGSTLFYYHRPCNRLIGYPQSFFTGEKGNDHNLHWAYFINAAATIGQFDPDWAKKENWGGMVDMLVRDVSTWDPNDPLFEPWSYFDPYEGHGWLDGQGFEIGNNHESTSESMNLDAAMIKWGMVTGNKALRDLGIFMYTQESRAVEQYWWDVDKKVFPADFAYPSVGMVWTNGGRYYTWFSAFPYHIAGIQYIPNTGGHLYFGRHPEYVSANFNYAATLISSYGWYDLQLEYLAYADPDRAMSLFESNQVDTIAGEVTESAAHTYYHLSSLRAVGRLDTTVVADVPSYAVFIKGPIRTYCAYNYDAQSRKVSYSDGFSMDVPAHGQMAQSRTVSEGLIGGRAQGRVGPRNRLVTLITQDEDFGKDARAVEIFDLSGEKIAESPLRNGRITDPKAVRKSAPGSMHIVRVSP